VGRDVVERAIAKLKRQIKIIMVDESQDTDQLQIELIASLRFERNFVLAANGNRISKNGSHTTIGISTCFSRIQDGS
jgi:superfamily I DNA/RNA helicase